MSQTTNVVVPGKPYICLHPNCDKSYTRFYHVIRHCAQAHKCTNTRSTCPNELNYRTETGSVVMLDVEGSVVNNTHSGTSSGSTGGGSSNHKKEEQHHHHPQRHSHSNNNNRDNQHNKSSSRQQHHYNKEHKEHKEQKEHKEHQNNDTFINNQQQQHHTSPQLSIHNDPFIYTEKPSLNKLLIIRCPHQSCTSCFTSKESLAEHLGTINHNCQSPFYCKGCEQFNKHNDEDITNNISPLKRKASSEDYISENDSDEETEDENEEDIDDKIIKMLKQSQQKQQMKSYDSTENKKKNLSKENVNLNINNISNNNTNNIYNDNLKNDNVINSNNNNDNNRNNNDNNNNILQNIASPSPPSMLIAEQ